MDKGGETPVINLPRPWAEITV